MNILELVPRQKEQLLKESKEALDNYKELSGINVPDILKVPIRSYEAAALLLKENIHVIPHIRAIDLPLKESIEIIKDLVKEGLRAILIVSGDLPDLSHQTYDIKSVELISALKEACPNLNIYGALDPYRQALKDEIRYCKEKLKAGASGFFTQPFFDLDLTHLYLEQLSESELFIGISPVVSETSKSYWINRNKAIFPKEFSLTLEGNAEIAKKIMTLTKTYKQNNYHMPIKVDVNTYLKSVFE